jgi:ADP-ribosylglycohydrolase
MLGAIAGDVIGSVHEGTSRKTGRFEPLFHPECEPTDDSVLTVAVAAHLLTRSDEHLLSDDDLVDVLKYWTLLYPYAGYGGNYLHWVELNRREPYNSFGNGSAMRVSPVAWAFEELGQVLHHAERTAAVTHNHPEGIKGAQATASAVFLARKGRSKDDIRNYLETTFGYDLHRELDLIRPGYVFDVTCQGTVPEAIIAFLEADSFEETVRNAISLGGDADTLACIAGSIAQGMWGVPPEIRDETLSRLDLKLRGVVTEFESRFGSK